MLIKTGDSGVKVKYLQQGLKIMCCNPGSIDSSFGTGTKNAVLKFQKDFGLDEDGIVGDSTWSCLRSEIMPIQKALKNKGYYTSSIDGIAGDGTYNAVLKFQKENGCTADGMVGTKTRLKLMSSTTDSSADTDEFPLEVGDKGDNITYLQYALRILCCNPGAADGIFGNGVLAAVKKFQTKYTLTVDGIVTTNVWSKIKTLVKEIQTALDTKGYDVGVVNGIAGEETYEQVIQYQKDNGLTADGMVGPATRALLLNTTTDESTDSFPLKIGSKGSNVLYLQYALRIVCINPKGTDGVFGEGTKSAVERFQQKVSLTADGIVGTDTWNALCKKINPLQQALINRGYYSGTADGVVNEDTYNAILKFQNDNGLTADGMAGTGTQNLLLGVSTGGGTTSSTLKLGSDGSLVRYLQKILQTLGHSVTIDGIFGKGTDTAIKSFQNSYGLTADGVVGKGTWSKLFEVYKLPVGGSGINKLIAVAKYELGLAFKEDNSNNITPYGQWYGLNGNSWCAMFVSWCATQAGIVGTVIPRYSYCPSGVNWYRNNKRYHSRGSGYIPKIGDAIFFYSVTSGRVAHTGIVTDVDNTFVYTIEGNTSDGVYSRVYNRESTYIDGYGDNFGEGSTGVKPTKEDIEKTLLDKFADLIKSCNAPYPQVPIVLQLNTKYEIPTSANTKVTYEAQSDTTLFDNTSSNGKFVIKNGVCLVEDINVCDNMSLTLNGISSSKDYINCLMELSMSIDTGEGTVSVSTDGEWFNVSYTIKTEVEINAYYSQAFSFSITFSVKKDTMDEAFAAQEVTDGTERVVSNKNTAIAVVLVGVCMIVGGAILMGSGGSTAPVVAPAMVAIVMAYGISGGNNAS